MLGARGVALGLGKINLNDLNSLPLAQRQAALASKKMEEQKTKDRPKVIVKKHVDKKTLWAACRAVVFASFLIVLGIIMTVLGYFARDLATTRVYNVTIDADVIHVNDSKRIQFDAMRFVGPVVMGLGTFILMIACVMTLESRDKNAQIFTEPSSLSRAQSRRSKRPSTRLGVKNKDEQKPLTERMLDENLSQNTNIDERKIIKDGRHYANNNNNEKMFICSEPALMDLNRIHGGMIEIRSGAITESRPSLHANPADRDFLARAAPYYYYAGPDLTGYGMVNKCYLRTDSDSVPYSTTTTTLSKSVRDSDINKFPSTSCIDTLIKSADTRVLLQRFLEDQSRMVADMWQGRKDSKTLKKQSNSLDVQGSDKTPIKQRTALSEGMPARHSIIAEVHHAEEPSPSPCSSTDGQPAMPPLVFRDSDDNLCDDSDNEEFCSPYSPMSTSMVSSSNTAHADYASDQQTLSNPASDASYVTLHDDDNGNFAFATDTIELTLNGETNSNEKSLSRSTKDISYLHSDDQLRSVTVQR